MGDGGTYVHRVPPVLGQSNGHRRWPAPETCRGRWCSGQWWRHFCAAAGSRSPRETVPRPAACSWPAPAGVEKWLYTETPDEITVRADKTRQIKTVKTPLQDEIMIFLKDLRENRKKKLWKLDRTAEGQEKSTVTTQQTTRESLSDWILLWVRAWISVWRTINTSQSKLRLETYKKIIRTANHR